MYAEYMQLQLTFLALQPWISLAIIITYTSVCLFVTNKCKNVGTIRGSKFCVGPQIPDSW